MNKEYLYNLKREVLNLKEISDIEKIMKYKTPYERFKEMALETPDAVALLYLGNAITYRQLLTLIDISAKGFSEIGVTSSDSVSMSVLSVPYAIVSFYALSKIGAFMHMVNSATDINEIKREINQFSSNYYVANDIFCGEQVIQALEDANIKKIITISLLDSVPMGFNLDVAKYGIIEKLKGHDNKKNYNGKILNYEELLNVGRKSKKNVEPLKYVSNRNAVAAYTSGSTGLSKACIATLESVDSMVQVMGMTEEGRFEKGDIMFTTFPLWIYYSLLNMIHEPLCLGVTLALDPLFDPKTIAKRNKQYNFNHWLTIPPYIQTMVKMNKKIDCSKWKIVLTGGGALDENLKKNADEYIRKNQGTVSVGQGYGASECLGSFAYTYYDNPSVGSMGKPCIGNKVKVLDIDTNEELGPNQVGVGYLYTPARMKEYYGDKDSTNHNLIKDENGVTWYNSEDLIHYNENGEIFHDGRIRRIVLTLDENGNPTKIIPDKVKKVILELDKFEQCEVITVPDEVSVNKSVAFLVLKSGINENNIKKEITEFCQNNLSTYMIPRDIMIVDSIPLTPAKKPDFKLLEEMYNNSMIETKEKAKLLNKIKKIF